MPFPPLCAVSQWELVILHHQKEDSVPARELHKHECCVCPRNVRRENNTHIHSLSHMRVHDNVNVVARHTASKISVHLLLRITHSLCLFRSLRTTDDD